MFLHMSIRFIDKDEKFTSIATQLFSICILAFQQISSFSWKIYIGVNTLNALPTSSCNSTKNVNATIKIIKDTYYVLIITSLSYVFGQNEKKQVDLTRNV